MKKYSLILLSALFIFAQNTAFALPIMDSADNKEFKKNDITTSLLSITIQDDSENPFITAENDVRIHIPSNIAIIFDQFETGLNLSLAGTAVSTGKVSANAQATYEDRDKTIVIPVDTDFEAGDTLIVQRVYVEGFNLVSDLPSNLELIYSKNAPAVKDSKTIIVKNSTNDDTTEPGKPTNVQITQISNTSVKLTWDLPTDLDVTIVKILRGLNHLPVSSDPYRQLGADTKEFVNEGLKVGDKVKFQLAVEDGPNVSEYTEIYEYTLVDFDSIQVDQPVDTVEDIPVVDENNNTEGEANVNENTTADSTDADITDTPVLAEVSFRDVDSHWAKDSIIEMAQYQIVTGNSDGSFTPDRNVSRADASVYIYRLINSGTEPTKPTVKPFPDVFLHKWYSSYIAELQAFNLINGYSDGSFKPESPVNRAEFLSLAMRVYAYTSDEDLKAELETLKGKESSSYSDIPADAWYKGDVNAATAKGFVNGKECGDSRCFDADTLITRAEAATILHRMFIERLKAE